MTLIKSISGIRGTIGGAPGEGMTPLDAVKFAAGYAVWLKKESGKKHPLAVIGRDARISGEMIESLVSASLSGMGVNVSILGLATTPTVEMAVTQLKADGGIILTASHNPKEWNALKLLNHKGEFLSAKDGAEILSIIEKDAYDFALVDDLGSMSEATGLNEFHIKKVLELALVNVDRIKSAGLKVVIDCVNSVGGVILPGLLKELGVEDVVQLYCEPNGEFPHNPEPLPENLADISALMKKENADVGFVVDPDVDRLVIVSEDGSVFGEEYTLVAVADYVLSKSKGNTCSNLSSSRALADITQKHGGKYYASAVGEVNVVDVMKKEKCVIGGEGNGGIIYPELHYGRDALVGIALFLSLLVEKGVKCSELRTSYPAYEIVKKKISLSTSTDIDEILVQLEKEYKEEKLNRTDGLRIDFVDGWVHLRKSNTEPIIRVIAEGKSGGLAEELASRDMGLIEKLI